MMGRLSHGADVPTRARPSALKAPGTRRWSAADGRVPVRLLVICALVGGLIGLAIVLAVRLLPVLMRPQQEGPQRA
jgi:hypothetical protein